MSSTALTNEIKSVYARSAEEKKISLEAELSDNCTLTCTTERRSVRREGKVPPYNGESYNQKLYHWIPSAKCKHCV